LRQYFPKRKSLKGIDQQQLDEIARKLNTRPRKTLDFKTPAEKLAELVDGAPKQPIGHDTIQTSGVVQRPVEVKTVSGPPPVPPAPAGGEAVAATPCASAPFGDGLQLLRAVGVIDERLDASEDVLGDLMVMDARSLT
jgi:hypothetical protein